MKKMTEKTSSYIAAITSTIPKKLEVPKIEGDAKTKNFCPSNWLILKSKIEI